MSRPDRVLKGIETAMDSLIITTAETSISDAAHGLAAASIAPATRRAYVGALNRLADWAGREPSDLNDGDIATYLAHMFDAGKSRPSAQLVTAAVRFQARLQGKPAPTGPATARVLAGFSRLGAQRGRGQAKGVRWEESARVAADIAGNGLSGARDAAIFAVASDALLRIGEIAAINCEDLEFHDDGTAILNIRKSKTDQEGRGCVMFLGAPTSRYLRQWIAGAGIDAGAVFRPVYRDVVIDRRLTSRTIARVIKSRSRGCGIGGDIRGHSLRVGGALSLAAAGASVVEMQQAGRWESPTMPGRYAAGELAKNGPVARLRYG